MKRSRLIIPALLLASVSLNIWQSLRRDDSPDSRPARSRVPLAPAEIRPVPQVAAAPAPANSANPPERPAEVTASAGAALSGDPSLLSEEELLYGPPPPGKVNAAATADTKVTPEKLKALAAEKTSTAAKFAIRAVLLLPGDRPLDLGTVEVEPGAQLKMEKTKEFPYPTSISFADFAPAPSGSFPVTPTRPGGFEFRNTGIELELDVTPAPGTLVLGGVLTHRVFDGFGRMPGEVFSPIVTTGQSESGKPVEVILTENKVLQPQFRVTECPILAAPSAGQTIRVPVSMAFGQTFLDLTCTPVE